MSFKRENWEQIGDKYYAKKANPIGYHLVGEFIQDRFRITGAVLFKDIPKKPKK